MSADPEVTVIGAGPVGMTVAALLGARGRRVQVIERRRSTVTRPRAVHLDHQAARILDAAGVMAALEPSTEPMDAYEWRAANGEVLLRMEPEGPVGRSGWPESLMFTQPDLEAALAGRLDALDSVQVDRGREITTREELGSGWVVACDGAGSTVRNLVGIDVDDVGYSFDWLIVDVIEHRPRRWSPCNIQVCDPSRPTTAVSGGPGRRRFEWMRLPDEDPADLATEAAAWRLLAPWGLHQANAALERHALYRFDARMATRWREGRVLLAGDAAHQMPPFAGQGLCAGLRDAANLSWKLDLVLGGAAPQSLLDTYTTERQAQTRTEIDFSVDLGRIVCITDTDAAATRDRDMVAAHRLSGPMAPPALPPLGPGVLLPGDPAAGTLAVQGRIGGQRSDDVVGRGWVLHGRRRDPSQALEGGTARWWRALGGASIDCSRAGDPAYQEWFESAGAAVILVRPDFAVFGTAPSPDGAEELVAALREQLGITGPRAG